jgi:hypothetical protein
MKGEGLSSGAFLRDNPVARERPLTGSRSRLVNPPLGKGIGRGMKAGRFSGGEEVMLVAVVFLGVMLLTLSLAAIVLAMAR